MIMKRRGDKSTTIGNLGESHEIPIKESNSTKLYKYNNYNTTPDFLSRISKNLAETLFHDPMINI